jgi:two-component system LytT family sensor kinase
MKRVLRTIGIIFCIALLGYVVRAVSGQFEPRLNAIIGVMSFFTLMLAWESLLFVNRWLNRIYPFERNVGGRIVIQLVIGAGIAVSIRLMIFLFGEPYVPFQLDKLFLAATWLLFVAGASVINCFFVIGYFVDKWKESIVQAERLEKEKAVVQFDNLKNQLNPHFLFNALTSLNGLISENQGLASQFLQHMSKVYRYVLQNKDKNFVTVQTELDFIQNYVFLLKTRYEQALTIAIDVRADALERTIVPVTLQILIENAIKHNVIDRNSPLSIDISSIGNYLIVSNNLQNKKIVEASNKQGLDNLKSLYRFMTDNPVMVEQTDTRFSVKVPLV